jgi:hypothetical protein
VLLFARPLRVPQQECGVLGSGLGPPGAELRRTIHAAQAFIDDVFWPPIERWSGAAGIGKRVIGWEERGRL